MILKNEIVYWRGGGYSGCIWEPNFGVLDSDGVYTPIISTGVRAIKDIDQLKRLLDSGDEDYEISLHPIKKDSKNRSTSKYLCENVRNDYVAILFDKLDELGYQLQMQCGNCGKMFDRPDGGFINIVNWKSERGDGGIGIIRNGPYCPTCEQERKCTICCEYMEDPEHFEWTRSYVYELISTCSKHVCEKCLDKFFYDNPDMEDEIEKHDEYVRTFKNTFERYIEALKTTQTVDDDRRKSLWDKSAPILEKENKTFEAKVRKTYREWESKRH